MDEDHAKSAEYLRGQLEDLLALADRLDMPMVALRVSEALDELAKG